MPRAELTIDLPERTWIHQVTTTHADATFRVLATMPTDDVGFALVEITAPELEPVIRSMVENPQINDAEPLQQSAGRVVVQIETTAPLLLLSAQASGIPIEPPVVIREGTAEIEVRASHDRLSTLGEELDRFGLSYTVEAVHEDTDPDRLLSKRQAELLLTAVECGYYDTPRECSLTELADAVGLAKSTCSETLHRAEGRVIRRFTEQNLVPRGDIEAQTDSPTMLSNRT
ncbi:helix-turn-helix domain-containing protein [Natronomonas gomsonensis]|jgi:predicted DNA binding protein|uniref:helix-turn-helix domain-containing protein n=1 Tax=Natronomonas gomsonensis TaxID=1046043 RepID=UPI0020CA95DC|nr:helix-turn-helix domain-containing protein [Natronomonas gomsonensis]MCY4731337.1 helix-turn-helix domain-containing protein [Natronomonas gomsonensis]